MENEINDKFEYSPLKDDSSYGDSNTPGAWGIRLIQLQPPSGQFISCSLIHTSLGATDGHYEALSYVWGKPECTERILVNGKMLSITSNLASALRRLRYPRSPRRLWIDAICINQENVEEKNLQVGRMWAIYALASQVIIDLGEETWNSSLGMNMIQRLANAGNSPQEILDFFNKSSDHKFSVACKGMRDIFDRPWWSRVWIVQEVAVASRAVVICGDRSLMWSDFEKVVEILTDLSFRPEKYVKAYMADIRFLYLPSVHLAPAWSVSTARKRFRVSEEHSLAATMISFKSTHATDPRDHLYGLLRLFSSFQPIVPDYTRTPSSVFMDVVRLSIKSDVGLAIFSALDYGNNRLDLPSWCPDWTAPSPANFPFYMPIFRCTKTKEVNSIFDGRMLTIRGIRLENITKTGSPSSIRMMLPLEEIYEAANSLRPHGMNPLDFTRRVAEFIERLTTIFARERYYTDASATGDLKDRMIAQIYGTWRMRRTLEIASNPGSYTLGVQHLSDKSALGVLNLSKDTQILNIAHGRRIFITENGELGLAPSASQGGDIVVALYGGRTPFCLRPISATGDTSYEIIGDW
ncbi:uncharacterized protein PV09_02074 [Verruconis gallopava]|uniref:Heterokaryon incompatibility domain-containing protein n=1 Tax=Verruconis gallopava TaxID=253628 RepID=A0A0D2B7H7_9PEZI|nr:uncharacterized protein PV09_02074 [Verruconis gallopava]KIW07209.1 hypothetical protein PV09_02074 [Verruconis gallopava]